MAAYVQQNPGPWIDPGQRVRRKLGQTDLATLHPKPRVERPNGATLRGGKDKRKTSINFAAPLQRKQTGGEGRIVPFYGRKVRHDMARAAIGKDKMSCHSGKG